MILYIGCRLHHGIRLREFVNRCKVEAQREELRHSNDDLTTTLKRLKETEAKLAQNEMLASIGRLNSGIAHELNNPLNFVKSAVYVLRKKTRNMPQETVDAVNEILSDIGEGVDRVASIVSDLRTFAHPESLGTTPVNLRDATTKAMRLMAKQVAEVKAQIINEVDREAVVMGDENLETYDTRIGILLTDQRMPGESSIELMERTRRIHPNLIRILVTDYTDYDSAVNAVNEGRAWRYLHNLLDPEEIGQLIGEAFTSYKIQLDRERLLYEKADDLRAQLMAEKVTGMRILAEGLNHHLRNALTVVRAFIDLAPMKLMEEIEGRMPSDPNFWVETQSQAQSQIERIQSLLTNVAQASHAKNFHALTSSISKNCSSRPKLPKQVTSRKKPSLLYRHRRLSAASARPWGALPSAHPSAFH